MGENTSLELLAQQVATVGTKGGFSLHVSVYVKPESVEKFMAAAKSIFDLVSSEPECLFFEVYISAQEPGKISWVENWSKSAAWFFANQINKEYYKGYMETTEPMYIKPREMEFYERAGPEFFMVKEQHFPQ
ncbi:hypothetical protein F4780DRAFT_575300 [Xylariomycetidae sp. FL0641]|nr:hypothetical protein F4780DRAFT_575300 [Xylariomycetidae sp. FL0641]